MPYGATDHGAARPDLDQRSIGTMPLWIVAGQLGTIVTILLGFNAAGFYLTPTIEGALMGMAVLATVLLGPVNRLSHVVVTLPTLLFLTWWLASYLWTFQPATFMSDAFLMFPMIVALVVFATFLPYRRFVGALVAACQVTIAWAFAYTLAFPGTALHHTDPIGGWPMSFGHKNGLAPFMLFAILTFTFFEERPVVRRLGIVAAIACLLLSQSMTGLVTGILLFLFGLFLRHVTAAAPRVRSSIVLGGAALGFVTAWLALLFLPLVVGTLGKDLTLTSRTDIWSAVLSAINERPWLGYGKGGVWFVSAAEPTSSIVAGTGFPVYQAHNAYLEMVLQLGIIGLVLYLGMLAALVRRGVKLINTDPAMTRYLILFVSLLAVYSITESATFGIWVALICAFESLAAREVLALPRLAKKATWSQPVVVPAGAASRSGHGDADGALGADVRPS